MTIINTTLSSEPFAIERLKSLICGLFYVELLGNNATYGGAIHLYRNNSMTVLNTNVLGKSLTIKCLNCLTR